MTDVYSKSLRTVPVATKNLARRPPQIPEDVWDAVADAETDTLLDMWYMQFANKKVPYSALIDNRFFHACSRRLLLEDKLTKKMSGMQETFCLKKGIR